MQPFVLRKFLYEKNWPPMHLWTDEYMCKRFSQTRKPKVRFGQKQRPEGEILHDNESINHEFTNFAEMFQWMKNDQGITSATASSAESSTNNQLDTISSSTHWAYLDYKDIFELLDEIDSKQVNWVELGVIRDTEGEQPWTDSTLWIGTPGAYTPCHFDTYGFNLHAQIRGYKRWLLFPPTNTEDLWPTRLPYEESSVFSSLDILSGADADSRLCGIMPRVVTIGPGDLLFVPPRWWHSVQLVESLKTNIKPNEDQDKICISVNKWIFVNEDRRESAKEALLKFMMAMHVNSGILDLSRHICLSEQESLEDLNEIAEFVQYRLDKFAIEQESAKEMPVSICPALTTSRGTVSKKPKLDSEEKYSVGDYGQTQLDYFYTKFSKHQCAVQIPAVEWNELRNDKQQSKNIQNKSNFSSRLDEFIMSPAENLKAELLEALNSTEVLETLLDVFMKNRIKREKQHYANATSHRVHQ